jgi:uncharacterized protein GlcG (DUF336 family)
MSTALIRLGGIGLACALALPANAELLSRKDLSANMALTVAATALEACTKQGYRVSVTVVGRNGEILVQIRGDNSPPHTMENSMRKAYTARTLRVPSAELERRVKENPQFALANLTNMIANRGALPIKVGDDTIGAAGASGAPGGDKDEACVQAGIDKISAELK